MRAISIADSPVRVTKTTINGILYHPQQFTIGRPAVLGYSGFALRGWIDAHICDLARSHPDGPIQPNRFAIKHRVLHDVLDECRILSRLTQATRVRDRSP
jgi:hypothetical protein